MFPNKLLMFFKMMMMRFNVIHGVITTQYIGTIVFVFASRFVLNSTKLG